jgi:putative oxidoreductase
MTLIRLVARPMLASMFLVGGVNSLRNTEATARRAEPVTDKIRETAHRVAPDLPVPEDPKTMVRINAAVHIVGGLALATGRAPRLSALALAATLVPTTAAGHRFWEESDKTARAQQATQFWKNVSMLGGLLLASVDTEGKPGLVWRTRHAATDARRGARHLRKEAKAQARLAASRVA